MRERSAFTKLACRIKLDAILREEIPALAQDALEEGIDTPSLRVLAVLLPDECDKARALFQLTQQELGIEPPTPLEALHVLASPILQSIRDGDISPCDGGFEISNLMGGTLWEHPVFDEIVICTDCCEAIPEQRSLYEASILELAREYDLDAE